MAVLPPAFLEEVRARTSIVALVRSRLKLTRRGAEHVGLCPFHAEKSGSFHVNEAKGFGHCFGCGAHVDAVGFVMRHDGLGFMDTVRSLAAAAGMRVPGEVPGEVSGDVPARPLAPMVKRPSPDDVDHEKTAKIAAARDIWTAAQPWRGTLVETYLAGRGVVPVEDIPTLRLAPRLKWKGETRKADSFWPAMVGAAQDVRGRITGVHRTYLSYPDPVTGAVCKAPVAAPKRMLGEMWGSAIRLSRAGARLGLSEGIETGLAVRRAVADLPIWAAGSLGNIAGGGDMDAERRRHPTRPDLWLPTVWPDMDRPGLILPDCVEEVVLLGDADGDRPTCEALVERAARRYADRRGHRCRVRLAWPADGMDFNDMIRGEVV
ncbi:hypothetical protein IP70_15730 [alpha proteobacterium AAP38]|nr:hypothetical protein IP70_15730 [alpha proteobacterium AAP38]